MKNILENLESSVLYLNTCNLFFVHIPKCAGTSIERALITSHSDGELKGWGRLKSRNFFPWRGPPWLDHLTAEEVVSLGYMSKEEWDGMESFSVTRNPWARLVSEYNWRGISWRYKRKHEGAWSFREFVMEYFPTKIDDNYLKGYDNYRHVIPQSRFTHSPEGKQLVGRVFDLGRLSSELPSWLAQKGLKNFSLSSVYNPSKARNPKTGEFVAGKVPLDAYFCSETDAFVRDYYRRDIELFGYEYPKLSK